MNFTELVGEGLNVLSSGSINFLVAIGLALTFRLMGVINLAHGEFLMVGAYVLLTALSIGLPFWFAVTLAVALGLVLGALTEILLIRRCYRSVELSILGTWGLSIVMQQTAELIFGKEYQNVSSPVPGATIVFGTPFSTYRLILIGVAILVVTVVLFTISKTPVGTQIRGISADNELAETLGVPARGLKTWVFAASTGLAALAGALVAPISTVGPSMGVDYVFVAFIIVIVAGKKIHMLAIAALVAALLQNTVTLALDPVLARISLLLLAAGVLIVSRRSSRLAPA